MESEKELFFPLLTFLAWWMWFTEDDPSCYMAQSLEGDTPPKDTDVARTAS
jgi:hypothetical protein